MKTNEHQSCEQNCHHENEYQSCSQTLDELDFEKSQFGCSVYGDLERLKQIVAKKHPKCLNDQDRNGYTCLHYAARHSHVSICAYLVISQRVDVNLKTNSCQSTPLHRAAYVGSYEIVKLLVENGARLAEQDCDGKTALHKLAEQLADVTNSRKRDDLMKCVRLLVERDGRLVNVKDVNEKTPIQIYPGLLNLD